MRKKITIKFCLTLFGFISIFSVSKAQYTWQNPLPMGNSLQDVRFVDSQTGWAVGINGALVKSTDGGASWNPQNPGTLAFLYGCHFFDAQTGFIVGSGGRVLKTTNGGDNWVRQTTNTTRHLNGIHFQNQQLAWAVGDSGTILKTTDAGLNWTIQPSGTLKKLNKVGFFDTQTGWAVGSTGTILKTTDGGGNWQIQPSKSTKSLIGLFVFDVQNAYVSSYADSLIKTSNGGLAWTKLKIPSFIYGAYFLNTQNGWYCGNSGLIEKTTNGGTSWSTQNSSSSGNNLSAIYFLDNQKGWSIGPDGNILRTSNGGINWIRSIQGSSTVTFNGVHFKNESIGLAVGDGGNIYRTPDGGNVWQKVTSGTTDSFFSINFDPSGTTQNAWAVGANGRISQSLDGGLTWPNQKVIGTETRLALDFFDGQLGFAVGTNGKITKTTNSGDLWFDSPSGTTEALWGISFPSNLVGYAVGFNGTIRKTTNAGTSWTGQSSGTTKWLFSTHFANATTGWAVGDSGVILKTSNGGNSWNTQVSGTLYRLKSVQFIDTQIGWATGEAAIILYTTNGGALWTPLNRANSIGFNALHFVNNRIGYLVGGFGNIVKTTSAGTCVLDPTIVGFQNSNGYADSMNVCQGGQDTLVSSYGFGNQWLLNNVPIPGATNEVLIVNGPGNYRVEVTQGICKDTSNTFKVKTEVPPSPATAGPDQTVCEGISVSLTGNIPAEGSGIWSIATGSGILLSPLSTNTQVTGLSPGTNKIVWKIVGNGTACPAEVDTLDVLVNSGPSITTVGKTRCGPGPIQLKAFTPSSGDELRWYAASSGGAPIFTGKTYNFSPTVSTSFFVESTDQVNGCISGRSEVRAFLLSNITLPRSTLTVENINKAYKNPSEACVGDTLILTAKNLFSKRGLKWFRNGNLLSDSTPIIKATIPGKYEFRHNFDGCNNIPFDTVTLKFKAGKRPRKPLVSVDQQPANCAANFTLSTSSSSNTNFQWFGNIEKALPNQTNNSCIWGSPGNFRVAIDSLGCRNISEPIRIQSQASGEQLSPEIFSVITKGKSLNKQRNEISWVRSDYDTNLIKKVLVFRRNDQTNELDSLAEISASDSTYIDSTSRPGERAYAYKIVPKRVCGNILKTFPASAFQESINLIISYQNPGLNIIRWTIPKGLKVDQFQIFRGSNFNNLVLWRDSISPNVNAAIDPAFNPNLFYKVEAISSQAYNPWGRINAVVRKSISNIKNQTQSISDSCGIVAGIAGEFPNLVCGGYSSLKLFAENGLGPGLEFNAYACQWFRNDSLISGQVSSILTANRSGVYRVVMRRGSCKDTSDRVLVKLGNCALKIEPTESEAAKKIIVFPNPHQNEFQVNLPENTLINSFRLFDMTGKEKRLAPIKNQNGEIRISTNGLPKGLYILELKGENWGRILKIMKE